MLPRNAGPACHGFPLRSCGPGSHVVSMMLVARLALGFRLLSSSHCFRICPLGFCPDIVVVHVPTGHSLLAQACTWIKLPSRALVDWIVLTYTSLELRQVLASLPLVAP